MNTAINNITRQLAILNEDLSEIRSYRKLSETIQRADPEHWKIFESSPVLIPFELNTEKVVSDTKEYYSRHRLLDGSVLWLRRMGLHQYINENGEIRDVLELDPRFFDRSVTDIATFESLKECVVVVDTTIDELLEMLRKFRYAYLCEHREEPYSKYRFEKIFDDEFDDEEVIIHTINLETGRNVLTGIPRDEPCAEYHFVFTM